MRYFVHCGMGMDIELIERISGGDRARGGARFFIGSLKYWIEILREIRYNTRYCVKLGV